MESLRSRADFTRTSAMRGSATWHGARAVARIVAVVRPLAPLIESPVPILRLDIFAPTESSGRFRSRAMLSFLRGGNKRTKTIWWVLIVVTVVTFLGGFVFLLGSGLDSTNRARMSGAVGTIDGQAVSRGDYQIAIDEQRDNFRRQNGTDPGSRDQRAVELLAWRSLVVEKLLSHQAEKLGLDAYDHEVVVKLRTNPPPSVTGLRRRSRPTASSISRSTRRR
jgi:hypothetical protein